MPSLSALGILIASLTACTGASSDSVDTPSSSEPVIETGDSKCDTAETGDTGETGETGETGDTGSMLGLPCIEGVTLCGEGAVCCTACCAGDELPVCTAVDAFGGCPMPDLSLDLESMDGTVDIQDVPFGEDSCALLEGCVDAPGVRRVLRFTTTTPNTGTADVFFGDVTRDDDFEYSECHEHTHFSSYADYALFAADGTTAATGHKQAFCLMDNTNWGSPSGARYTCDFQGISMGWADTYASWLDCQWIDITEVPAGDYTLRVTINPDHLLPELDYTNNMQEVSVTIAERESLPPVTDPCPGLAYGEYRDCGWAISASASCTPGTTVEVNCDTTCLGACVGDPVLRVCEGTDNACIAAEAIGANDRAECGSWCPAVNVTCPDTGLLTALTTGWSTEIPGECTISVTPL